MGSHIERALFMATLDSLDTPHHLGPAVASAAAAAAQALVIVLFSKYFELPGTVDEGISLPASVTSRSEKWDDVQRLLTYIYVQATKVAQDHGKVLMDISVLLKGTNQSASVADLAAGMNMCFLVEGDETLSLPNSVKSLPQAVLPSGDRGTAPTVSVCTQTRTHLRALYPVVALGGTFDHLHAGHKILLSMAAWITEVKLIVGLTDEKLLKNKSNRHVMESTSTRMEKTRSFLQLFRIDLEYDLVPIRDVYGPTGWDPNIQALVVSKETLSGAAAIDKERARKSLPALQTFVIDVISADSEKLDHEDAEMLKQTKMSSTFIRDWIVRHELSANTTP
ncbi:hypothetical protein F5I97DRAFT_1845899 [Phlebopus sp. FC_14]|nr:hypothetical protein F5I97DRAFT_1845899 [Phlebopus sp. FC_14]